jgi:O-Antigen ligase
VTGAAAGLSGTCATLLPPSRPVRLGGSVRFGVLALMVVGVPLALPYALIAALGGSLVRTAYPAYILLAACVVIVKYRPLYPAFILAAFAFAPFLRRVADYQAGFAVFNLILLAPYIGLLPTLPALSRRALNGSRSSSWPFALITACVLYGAFLALFRLAIVPAVYEAMRWLLPTSLCAFIMAEPEEAETVRRAVINALCLIVPILALYGIYQFLEAPLWDVFWMNNVDNPTFGVAEALKIRVFSMMNSPGTVGVFVSYAMIMLAGEGLGTLAVAATGIPLLALTLIRTAWFSVAVGLVVLFWYASGGRKLVIITGVVGIAVATGAFIASPNLPPDIRDIVTERLDTFTTLNTDTSAHDRLSVYDAFFERLADSPWGEGFGANASTVSMHATQKNLVSIDSGLLECYLVFGIGAGTMYFLSFAALLRQAWRALPTLRGKLDGNFAVICATVAVLPLGSNQIGELGVLVWTALGTLLACGIQLRRDGARAADSLSGWGAEVTRCAERRDVRRVSYERL